MNSLHAWLYVMTTISIVIVGAIAGKAENEVHWKPVPFMNYTFLE